MENSLDAQSANIKINIEMAQGLIKWIEIIDDGIGIKERDLLNLSKWYHTSKIISYQ